ncbi:MAG: ATP-binding protein [Kofleriaceae bacterium]|nr:ATP-binding protein [Kofleriaceae bacterium]MBP9168399.1 ATP-binding protein [Kofleriaceae bacterium]MBP9861396.1 ATP-binding protein [Kofleriaceae bacterium]
MTAFFDECRAYVGFGDEDSAQLAAIAPMMAPHYRAICDAFYAAVASNATAAAMLGDPGRASRLRVTLIDWMDSGLRGPHDEAFYQKRSRIGRRHVEIALPQQFMFTAMNVVRTAYLERLAAHLPPAEAHAASVSVNKLLDLELAIMLRHYQLDSEERILAREHRIQDEKLGAMRTLTAGLAHEVRNPLNAAKLQLELLGRRLKRAGDDPKLIEPGRLVQHELERLTVLLNELLSFARPSSLNAVEHDLVAIVRQVIEIERPLAFTREIELELVGPSAAVLADVDAGKFHQIVQNLVRNAIEAAPARGRVEVTLAAGRDQVQLRVSDDGPGIPPEVAQRIFEPFFSTKEGGTGMGMAIVHSLVTQHRGVIDLGGESSGTVVTVSLPRYQRRDD